MIEPVKIVVIVHGGMVQDIVSAGVPVEFVTVDYDIEGAEDEDWRTLPHPPVENPPYGRADRAFVSWVNQAEVQGAWALAIHEIGKARA